MANGDAVDLRTAQELADDERANAILPVAGRLGEGPKMLALSNVMTGAEIVAKIDAEIGQGWRTQAPATPTHTATATHTPTATFTPTHTQPPAIMTYAVWTNSAATPSEAEFLAGRSSQSGMITPPADPARAAYLHFATTIDPVTDIRQQGGFANAFGDFTAGDVQINGQMLHAFDSTMSIRVREVPWVLS